MISKISPGDAIAAFALIVSVFSVFFSSRTFKLQRMHNQKSLKPILSVIPFDYSNCLKVELKNEGIGPAIIEKIHIEMNEYEAKNTLYKWMPSLPMGLSYRNYLTRSQDIPMVQGAIITMLEININPNDVTQREYRERMRAILRQLTVKIRYKDIYDNGMNDCIYKLELYGRDDNG